MTYFTSPIYITCTLFCLFTSCVTSQNEWGRNTHKTDLELTFYERGMASYYSNSLKGTKTQSGERYDPNLLTAASKTLPFNTIIVVKSVSSGRFVIVRINDRGPFSKNRMIDLSEVAAKKIGIFKRGVGKVDVYIIKERTRHPGLDPGPIIKDGFPLSRE